MHPSRPARRCASVAAVLLAVVAGQVPAAAAAPDSSADIAAQVRALDREVNRVSDELGRGAAAYEAAQAHAALLAHRQFDVRQELEARSAAVDRAQEHFGDLARAAYKGSVPPLVAALLTGDPRAVGDLAYVHRSVERVGAERHEQLLDDVQRHDEATDELARTDAARRDALAAQGSADAQLRALVARADELTAELAAQADRLAQARADERAAALARAAAAREATARSEAARRAVRGAGAAQGISTGGGAGCQPPSTYGEANGFLSPDGLCTLGVGGGHRLRTDAARAFDLLNDAHVAAFGTPVCVTDSYRSYAAQVDVFKRKPMLAATPGRSQHGWGLAVDLCGGVQTFGSAAHAWMRANAGRFGWVHPRWAQIDGSRPEAWHWEYVGG